VHSPNHNPVARPASELPDVTRTLADEAATIALGSQLAGLLAPGMVVWLDGDLGAGKTTLVRSLLRTLGYRGPVKSPTYTLVEVYVVSRIYWYHFDFYRFNVPEEFEEAGLGEYFRKDAVCLVEWPEKGAPYVPAADLELRFRFPENSASGRLLEFYAGSEAGRACLSRLRLSWANAVS